MSTFANIYKFQSWLLLAFNVVFPSIKALLPSLVAMAAGGKIIQSLQDLS